MTRTPLWLETIEMMARGSEPTGDDIDLPPLTQDLSPLPASFRRGMTAMVVLALISLISSTAVFLFLAYRLIRWRIKTPRVAKQPGIDLSLGLPQHHFGSTDARAGRCYTVKNERRGPNQFLVLVFNLFLADMHQAIAFVLNAAWLATDSVRVSSPICFVQGWFVSTGDLPSSLFILAIAVHTYLAVVRGYSMRRWALNTIIIGIWVMSYLLPAIGVAATRNGKSNGGYFVRSGVWCWVNKKYQALRFLLHYLYVLISLVITPFIYALIFLSLRRGQHQKHGGPEGITSRQKQRVSQTSEDSADTGRSEGTRSDVGSNPDPTSGDGYPFAFLLYPLIYFVCTAPLASARLAIMVGAPVSNEIFCVAGAFISSNGFLDVLLWTLTRRTLLFDAEVDNEATGAETFDFLRTPHERRYGNIIWIQGNSCRTSPAAHETGGGRTLGWVKKWLGWQRLQSRDQSPARWDTRRRHDRRSGQLDSRSSQESLHRAAADHGGNAIQMDMVTTVVVEDDRSRPQTTYTDPGWG